jgi:exosortase/archaeosortase family protein
MTRRRLAVAARLTLVFAVAMIVFLVFVEWFRRTEARIVVELLQAVGIDRVSDVVPGAMVVFPERDAPFVAVVTRSCTSLGALVAVGALTLFVIRGHRGRRLMALALTSAVMVIGNLLRMSGSVIVGIHSGRNSLVLFHDWIATGFGMVYTLAGLVLMLWLLLPPSSRAGAAAREAVGD